MLLDYSLKKRSEASFLLPVSPVETLSDSNKNSRAAAVQKRQIKAEVLEYTVLLLFVCYRMHLMFFSMSFLKVYIAAILSKKIEQKFRL